MIVAGVKPRLLAPETLSWIRLSDPSSAALRKPGIRSKSRSDSFSAFLISGAPQREVYFMGLIDVLTQYDTKKKAAHAAKTVKHGVSSTTRSVVLLHVLLPPPDADPSSPLQAGAEISTVHPEQYAKRFRDFISKIFA